VDRCDVCHGFHHESEVCTTMIVKIHLEETGMCTQDHSAYEARKLMDILGLNKTTGEKQ